MNSGARDDNPDARSEKQRAAMLESRADKLLAASLKALGRGEYPFFSRGYLRRMTTLDERALREDDRERYEPQLPASKIIWQLARKARLSSIEMDIVRLAAAGERPSSMARILRLSPGRSARLLRNALDKMREYVAEATTNLDEQIACVMHDEQRRRGSARETHCKPGQELCRRTGLCPRRWYLYEDRQ